MSLKSIVNNAARAVASAVNSALKPQPTDEKVLKVKVGHRSIELKVKGMTLAQESRIIKKLEKKFRDNAQRLKVREWVDESVAQHQSLYNHRMYVKRAARATNLAYGFLRGVAYSVMENKRYSNPDWDAITKMIVKYGKEDSRVLLQRFAAWKDEAGSISSGPKPTRTRPSNKKPS